MGLGHAPFRGSLRRTFIVFALRFNQATNRFRNVSHVLHFSAKCGTAISKKKNFLPFAQAARVTRWPERTG
jgi:hypothetical protein